MSVLAAGTEVREVIKRRLPGHERDRWLVLLVALKAGAVLFAAALVVAAGLDLRDVALVALAAVHVAVTAVVLARRPALRRVPATWIADLAVASLLVVASDDWRSPFFPLWLSALALPAVHLPLARALAAGIAAPIVYLGIAIAGGPVWGELQAPDTESLAIHLVLPAALVVTLAYAADALRRLEAERRRGERLAIENERRRIAWELHDSAKQRLHAAHLLVSSLRRRVDPALGPTVEQAVTEIESAGAELDTSVAELRAPLEGTRLADALRARAAELSLATPARIVVRGDAKGLPPLVAAHAFRIAVEAMTNAARHADATAIEVEIEDRDGDIVVSVADDGRGLPAERSRTGSGLVAMRSRAATLGGRLEIAAAGNGGGTLVRCEIPRRPAGTR